MVISQNARVDTCQYVERIDHSDIKEADIYDGEIHFNNIVLSCPVVDTSTAGPVKLIYTWNDLTYELLAIIRDTEAPIIEIDSEIIIQAGIRVYKQRCAYTNQVQRIGQFCLKSMLYRLYGILCFL